MCVVLRLELAAHELPHVRVRHVAHVLQMLLDRIAGDESMLSQVVLHLLHGDGESVCHGCAKGGNNARGLTCKIPRGGDSPG